MGLLQKILGKQAKSRGIVAISFLQNQVTIAVANYSAQQTPYLSFCDNLPCTEPEQQHLLNELSKKHNLDQYSCHLVLTPEQYRLITLESPAVDESEIKQALRWKINDLIEYPADQAILDYYPLPDSSRANSNKMLDVIASPKKEIQVMVEKCQNAGLIMSVIDIQETVLRNIATLLPENDQGIAVLYLQKESGRIIIQKQGTLYLSRKIAFGYQTLKLTESVDSLDQLNQESDKLALELQRSMDYIENYFGIPPISGLAVIPMPENTQQLLNFLNNNHAITGRIMDLSAIIDGDILLDDHIQCSCAPVIGATLRNAMASS